MGYANLKRSKFGDAVQAMPYEKGYIDLTSGNITGKNLIMCKAGGDIIITFEDATTHQTTMTEGESRAISSNWTISITTGTYDFSE